MPSSSRPSDDKFYVTRAPSHIEIPSSDAEGRSFPPSGAPWQPTFSLSFDAANSSAFAKLRVDFTPKASSRTVIPLFVFIPPERVASLSVEDADTPQSVRPELQTNLTRLSFTLNQPVTIISPSTSLIPKNKASGDVLEMLQCIAKVTSFSVYLPSRYLPCNRAALLCRMVHDGGLQSLTSEANISHLYNGKGGNAYEAGTFNPFGADPAPVDSPPSYDELALSPPPEDNTVPPYSGRPSKKRRTTASSSKSADQYASGEAIEDVCRQIVNDMKAELRKELRQELRDEMRDEFRSELNRELEKLKGQIMEGIDKRLDERDKSLQKEMEEYDNDVREYVDDNREDVLEDASELIDLRIDDQLTGIKDELQSFVTDELKNVEDRIKDDISACELSLVFN